MRRVLILATAAVSLAACSTTDPEPPASPALDPCPPSAMAELEPRIPEVPVTGEEQLALDQSGLRILGPDRFSSRELSLAQAKGRTRRLETRIEQTRAWCVERRPKPG